jgi:trimeric autotransporter adhesin
MKWGYWGTKPKFDSATPVETNVHLGTWVAGKVANEDAANVEIPLTGNATYNGHAVGNVTNAGNQYLAAGDLELNWDFAARSGDMTISNFDGLTFGTVAGGLTPSNAAGSGSPAEFGGALSGSGLTGSASGAFTLGPLNPTLETPQGVMGAFDVTNGTDYSASGTFMGAQ